MYAGVPSSAPVLVTSEESSVSRRATPKSVSSRRPFGAIITFAGLMSRWTIAAACAAASASARSAPMHATTSGNIGPRCSISWSNDRPRMISMTMYGGSSPSAPPTS